jgi:hypothetical protein
MDAIQRLAASFCSFSPLLLSQTNTFIVERVCIVSNAVLRGPNNKKFATKEQLRSTNCRRAV